MGSSRPNCSVNDWKLSWISGLFPVFLFASFVLYPDRLFHWQLIACWGTDSSCTEEVLYLTTVPYNVIVSNSHLSYPWLNFGNGIFWYNYLHRCFIYVERLFVHISLFQAQTTAPLSGIFCTDLHTNSGKVLNTSLTPLTWPLDPGVPQTPKPKCVTGEKTLCNVKCPDGYPYTV